MSQPTEKRLVTPFDMWPEIDRQLWQAGLTPVSGKIVRYRVPQRRPATDFKAALGHGRLLAIMAAKGLLDPTQPPAKRVSPEVMEIFVADLIAAGNKNYTINTRIWDERRALKIMQPNYDSSWLTRPGGVALGTLLPVERRRVQLIGITILYDWVLDLIEQAVTIADPRLRAVKLRDGLILAILVARAPRIRSLTTMRLGRNLRLLGGDVWIKFFGDDLKVVGKRLDYRLPPALPSFMKRYTEIERYLLLDAQMHDALWVGENGLPLTIRQTTSIVRLATKARFGTSFGPQRFRHELATALARDYPDNPGLVAAILGITIAVAERYYIQALEDEAARLIGMHLEQERARTHLLAAREFSAR